MKLKVRVSPEGSVRARRLDGKPLTDADRERARTLALPVIAQEVFGGEVMDPSEFEARHGHAAPGWPKPEERCDRCGFHNINLHLQMRKCENCGAEAEAPTEGKLF